VSSDAPTTLAADEPPASEEPSSKVMTVARAWQRVKEHKVIQWAVAYFAAALALAHAEELIAHAYEWPESVGQILIGVLALGFLVALVLAWYHGHKGLTSFSKAEMSILAMLMIVGAGMLYLFVQPSDHAEVTATAAAAPQASPIRPAGLSVAVLPFMNLSADKDQEFFSDGMTEEITSALAKVQGLNVVARTSAFQFKGENKDMRTIGRALGASHLIEGSVRKAGDKVRITAQLIKADDGTHLWSESYDRELKDVFAVQEDIAKAIAGALQVPLGLSGAHNLVANRTGDTEAYQNYLRAKGFYRSRGAAEPGGPLTQAADLLEHSLARDGSYAPAWGTLALVYSAMPAFSGAVLNGRIDEERRIASESLGKAERAADQAIKLDPKNVDAYTALAQVRRYRGKFAEADDLFSQALAIDPGNPDALHLSVGTLSSAGRLIEVLPFRRRLQAKEPFYPQFNRSTAVVLWATGGNDEAIALLKAQPPVASTLLFLAKIYASMGRYKDAADSLQRIPAGTFQPGAIEEAVRLLRTAPSAVKGVSRPTFLSMGQLGFVYLYVGAPERALDFFDGAADAQSLGGATISMTIWTPGYAPLRNTERFKRLVRKMGLVDYWRAKGWPEFCHPAKGDDFTCH
jgi:TolB-like protein